MALEPCAPAYEAVMAALPGACPVTRPFASTEATPAASLYHATCTGSTAEARVTVAVSCSVAPATSAADEGATATAMVAGGSSFFPQLQPAIASNSASEHTRVIDDL